jgi:hypothetical protein
VKPSVLVYAVRDQGRRVDLPAYSDSAGRDQLIPDESDQSGDGDPAHIRDWLRVDDAASRLNSGHDRRHSDHRNDEQARQIFDAAVAERVPT